MYFFIIKLKVVFITQNQNLKKWSKQCFNFFKVKYLLSTIRTFYQPLKVIKVTNTKQLLTFIRSVYICEPSRPIPVRLDYGYGDRTLVICAYRMEVEWPDLRQRWVTWDVEMRAESEDQGGHRGQLPRYLVTAIRADVPIIRECHRVTIRGTNVITNNVITPHKISRAINHQGEERGLDQMIWLVTVIIIHRSPCLRAVDRG